MKTKHLLKPFLALIVLAALGSLLLTGCSSAKTLSGAERDAVLEYTEPAADDLFKGMNSADYALFSTNFDDTLKKSIDEAGMGQIETSIIGKIGKYISREVERVETDGKLVTVIYSAKFEQEDDVTVRLVFTSDEAHQVSGLWFNSPKLQAK